MDTLKNVLIAGVVALAVAVVAVLVLYPSTSSAPTAGFSQVDVGKFPEGAQIGDPGLRFYNVSIPAGSNQTSYKNTSGRDQFVTVPALRTTGVASSTYRILVGTSTAATIANYTASNLTNTGALISVNLATSTQATTTSSVDSANVNGTAGVVRVPSGAYVNIAVIQGFPTPSPTCTGATCETATSTNRGFNITGVIQVLQPTP